MTAGFSTIEPKKMSIKVFYIVALYVVGIRTTLSEAKRCFNVPYDVGLQGCCNGKVYNLEQDGVRYACCTEAKKLYKQNEQTCCGGEIRSNTDIHDLVCCENHFRQRNEGICCGDTYYENGNKLRDKCCEKKMHIYYTKDYVCCKGKLHKSLPGEKCCGSETYNRATKWCKNKNESLPYGSDICGKEEYKIATHVCCQNQKVQKKMHLTDDRCCGSTSYNSTKDICVNDTIVDRTLPLPKRKQCGNIWIDIGNQECCNNTTVYDPLNEKCCGGKCVPLPKRKQCGNIWIDIGNQECCNNTTVYDPLNEKCCGGIVLPAYEKCCDGKRLDTKSFICCMNESGEKQSRKFKPEHDKCCILNNGSTETYNSIDYRCSLDKVVSKDRCGPDEFNPANDLCCQGVLKKKGRLYNLDCCGVVAYDVLNETCEGSILFPKKCGSREYDKNKDLCCSGVLIKKGVMLNKACECPHYCQQSWLNTTSWENEIKNINCDYKDYRISNVNDTKWITKSKKPKKDFIWFKEDCSCITGSQKSLILLAKKVTKKGEIKERFYVLPDRKYFRKSVEQLKQRQHNCNRKNNRRKGKI